MRIQVITAATRPCAGLSRFYRSCARFGFSPVVLGLNRTFNGTEDRFGFYREWFAAPRRVEGYTHLLVVDSTDLVFGGGLEAIGAAYEASGENILFAAERNCWPDPELAEQYPATEYPCRFLNAGGFIGPAAAVISLCAQLPVPRENDQLTLTKLLLEGGSGIGLDRRCRVFQCLLNVGTELDWRGDGIYNRRTQTRPLIFHGNGLADMSEVLAHPQCQT